MKVHQYITNIMKFRMSTKNKHSAVHYFLGNLLRQLSGKPYNSELQ